MFVAVGHDGLRLTSNDGLDWKNRQLGKEGEVYRAVAFGNDVFAAVGGFGGRNIMAATRDGTAWTTSGNDAKYVHYFRGLCFGDGRFVALGGDPGSVGSAKPFIATSADGSTWSDFQEFAGKWMIRRAAYGNGVFVGVGDRGRRARSKDAVHWDDAPDVKPIDTLVDVAFGNGIFVGVGLHGLRTFTKDGLKWSEPLRGNEGEHINTVLRAGDRFVAIGAGATFFSADGADWERRPNRDAPVTACFGAGVFVGARWKGRLLHSKDAVSWTETYREDRHLEAVAYSV